ncbi:LysR family transcriptional regulator [Oceanibium sediminis]|uniref:LysR family transcriptional regulator n=1 Tax=Oceanibium sediminis TaxID=2026339 RepID=UPI000DD36872|nr:LysR family transcriptional regulator [Oceanibium sediminis]
MDRLSEMEAFISVVDQGGFTEAAKKLGVSKSAVSKHVSALEARLGARLLNRTTRRVNPTEIGLAYYDRATVVLSGAAEADEMVNAMQTAPRGALRISVPVSFGISQLSGIVGAFLAEYPDVSVNMVLDDRFVELVAEGFDVAIRIGKLEDSSLRARKLAETQALLVASKSYLDVHGTPACIEDLSAHTLLHYSHLSTGNFWRLRSKTGEERHVRVGGRLTANNGESLKKAAESGLGISLVPTFILGSAIEDGRLINVLPDLALENLGIYAVYPPGRFTQPKVRAFIDFLAEKLRGLGPERWPG